MFVAILTFKETVIKAMTITISRHYNTGVPNTSIMIDW